MNMEVIEEKWEEILLTLKKEFDLSDLRCAVLPLAGGFFHSGWSEFLRHPFPFSYALGDLGSGYDPADHPHPK